MLALSGSRTPEIQELADYFDRQNMTMQEALAQLDTAVRGVYRFRSDGEIEMIRTPQRMMQDWNVRGYLEGDCDDISTFLACVVRALGGVVRFVAIRTDPANPEFLHVFCEAKTNGTWVRLDPTVSNSTDLVYYGVRMEQIV